MCAFRCASFPLSSVLWWFAHLFFMCIPRTCYVSAAYPDSASRKGGGAASGQQMLSDAEMDEMIAVLTGVVEEFMEWSETKPGPEHAKGLSQTLAVQRELARQLPSNHVKAERIRELFRSADLWMEDVFQSDQPKQFAAKEPVSPRSPEAKRGLARSGLGRSLPAGASSSMGLLPKALSPRGKDDTGAGVASSTTSPRRGAPPSPPPVRKDADSGAGAASPTASPRRGGAASQQGAPSPPSKRSFPVDGTRSMQVLPQVWFR
jgi:hypothetical protein